MTACRSRRLHRLSFRKMEMEHARYQPETAAGQVRFGGQARPWTTWSASSSAKRNGSWKRRGWRVALKVQLRCNACARRKKCGQTIRVPAAPARNIKSAAVWTPRKSAKDEKGGVSLLPFFFASGDRGL